MTGIESLKISRKEKSKIPPSRMITPKEPATPLTPILQLQRLLGNQAIGRLVQAKLKIGQPGDPYEQEADQVANTVMTMPEPRVQRTPT